ncbi:MAG: type II secretion system protein GspG [Candidatus Krumholzibacteriota bacterium]|nr:type II secretion system protein GspG [Candidatus Krumholzibacteriota bacterium]
MRISMGNQGFTLFEIIIAVAIIAIMAVAIAPPLIKNLNDGKIARAQSDAKVIGDALMFFYKDTGTWPLQNDGDTAPDLTRLVGNSALGGGNAGIPGGTSGVNGSGNWDSWGRAGTLTDQLIANASGSMDPLYRESSSPHTKPGWNGPYLDSVPLDPWGNPYVVNIRFVNAQIADYTRHNVMVLSAGPNGVFETPYADVTFNEEIGGDDVGYIIRGSVPE